MDLILLVIVLSVIGCVVYLITSKLPMDPTVRMIIQVGAALAILLYLLRRFFSLPNVL